MCWFASVQVRSTQLLSEVVIRISTDVFGFCLIGMLICEPQSKISFVKGGKKENEPRVDAKAR